MAPDATDPSETTAFTSALARLKREGSNLLVVGAVSDAAHGAACVRLFGADDGDRRRVVVETGAGGCVRSGDRPDDAVEISYRSDTRGAVAASTPGVEPDVGPTEAEDLAELGTLVTEAVETAEADADGLAPAQLRVCVDSLVALLEAHPERETFRFLHAVTSQVRAVDGMGHYHLPLARDADVVGTLTPLFEAVVELRETPEGPQQRWRLRDPGIETDWLPL